jgi:hypothetical protein
MTTKEQLPTKKRNACDRHFASGHTQLFWPDGFVEDIRPMRPEDELPERPMRKYSPTLSNHDYTR